ncbi:MAG: MBL fold metallo-hydrolase, partial [Acidobacteriota bacterium]
PFVVVLGTAQDGGRPQAAEEQGTPSQRRRPRRAHVACLALVAPERGRRWMIDATPDFPAQLAALDRLSGPSGPPPGLDGIFLTHAHIGHYTGLMHLGREVIGAHAVPVWVMPRMSRFLATSGPWSQLVELDNIRLRPLTAGKAVDLGHGLTVTPLPVPHRDEFSETVGFLIEGPHRRVLYVPDIDKWSRWERPLPDLLASVDRAYLDGTFLDATELPGRSMADIPHPFIVETLALLSDVPATDRAKVFFIHLNHTNPAGERHGPAARRIRAAGMHVAREGERFGL